MINKRWHKTHEMKETWYTPALTWRSWGN